MVPCKLQKNKSLWLGPCPGIHWGRRHGGDSASVKVLDQRRREENLYRSGFGGEESALSLQHPASLFAEFLHYFYFFPKVNVSLGFGRRMNMQ